MNEEFTVYEKCRGCDRLLNPDVDLIVYGYCSKCMIRDYNNADEIFRSNSDSSWDRVKRFTEAANKYGTDKGTENGSAGDKPHNYMGYYAAKLPLNPQRLLEIGCFKGASLRMWREFFPKCELHTIDLFEENPMPTDIEGLICWKGNQADASLLEKLPYGFDVIIDDGSHGATDMQASFDVLFKRTNLYVIEDLHCLNDEHYRYVQMIGEHKYYMPFEDTILGKMQAGKFPHRFDLFDNKIAFIYAD